MRKCLTACAVLVAICLPGALTAADWPQFQGPYKNCTAPDTKINKSWNTKPPKVLWTVPLTDAGFSGPAVSAGKVYIIDHKESKDIVRAIDINTGKEAWNYVYDEPSKDNWGYTRATPVIDSGKIYTQSKLGTVNCLDAKTGKLIWTLDMVKEFGGRRPGWEYTPSPVVDKEKLIIMPGGPEAGVVALNKLTGKAIWKSGSNVPSYATPVVARIGGVAQYVIFDTVELQGLDAMTGKKLWGFPWKTGSDCNAATPIVMGDSIYITTGYGHGCALVDVTKDGAKARWENKEMLAHFSTPVLYKGYVYGNSDPNHLVCMDPKTGKAMWKQDKFGKGALVLVDNVLIAINGSGGDVVMVDPNPEAYKELGRIKPLEGNECWVAPIISNGKLIVRDRKNMVCLDLK